MSTSRASKRSKHGPRNRSTAAERGSAGRSPSWLNLRTIEVFVAVVQQDGMTNAAHRLGTTQSAVSQAITAIETGLGAQLIDRTIRPMQLTLFGRKFYEHAVEVLRSARELEQIVDLQQHDRLPLVRIGMVDSFASTVGPHLLGELAGTASRWSVASGVQHTSLKALSEQRVDLIVTSEDAGRSPDLIVIPLLREPFFIVVPKRMAIGGGGIEELAGRSPLIRYSARAFISQQVEAYLQHHDVSLPRRYELDTSDAVLAMVKAGHGWTITTPLCLLKTQASLDDFRYLPLESPGAVRRVRLVAHRDQYVKLWQRVASTSRAILETRWMPAIRQLVPWDTSIGSN